MNRVIAAPRERVFEAWTTPEEIKVWFGPETCSVLAAQIDLRVNREYCFDRHGWIGCFDKLEKHLAH